LWQNILDTQVTVSYTANSEKRVLINFNHSINVDRLDRKEAQIKTGISDSSAFSKHLSNAVAIKENVEQGIFPGRTYWGKSFLKKD